MQTPNPIAQALLLACATAAAPAALAQQVYKCVKAGQTSYQSAPCEAGSNATSTQVRAQADGLPWDGLRRGMSPEQVKRITDAEDESGGGPVPLLRKRDLTLAGMPFIATYQFDTARQLVSVTADRQGEQGTGHLQVSGNEVNLPAYTRLTALVRSRYGAEASSALQTRDTGFRGLAARADWSVDGGRCFVNITPISATTSSLSIGLLMAARQP